MAQQASLSCELTEGVRGPRTDKLFTKTSILFVNQHICGSFPTTEWLQLLHKVTGSSRVTSKATIRELLLNHHREIHPLVNGTVEIIEPPAPSLRNLECLTVARSETDWT